MNSDTYLRPPASFSLPTSVVWGALLALLVVFGTVPGAVAQSGPGGVGDATGSGSQPTNTLWLRAGDFSLTDGDEITSAWQDQSGNNDDATFNEDGSAMTYQTGVVNGLPVVRFTQGDNFDVSASALSLSGETNTILIVSADDGTQGANEHLLTTTSEDRSLTYYYEDKNDFVGSLAARAGNNKNNDIVSTSALSATSFNILSTTDNGSQGGLDLFVNGTSKGQDGTKNYSGETGFVGQNLGGDVAEVIVFDDPLNAAQIEIVANYLSEKYGISIDGSSSSYRDLYQYSVYGFDVAGIGDATGAIGSSADGVHEVATSDRFTIDGAVTSTLSNGDFFLFGHDGGVETFISGSTINGSDQAERLRRLWRADMTGATSHTVDVTVDLIGLSLGSSFNDFVLLVDADGDFTSGADVYDLDGSGTASNVSIRSGDFVSIARINRTVTLQTDLRTRFENATPSTPTITATMNFASSTAVSFDVQVAPSSTRPPATAGRTDYSTDFATATQVTLPAGATSIDLNSTAAGTAIDINDDGISENNTEFVELTLSNFSGASGGAFTAQEFGIIDDDNSNKTSVTASGGTTTLAESASGTFTADVFSPVGNVEVFYEITGDATLGDDYTTAAGQRGSLTFSSSGTQQISFDPETDVVFEGSEDIVFTLTAVESTGGSATIDNANNAQTFTITDDNTQPTVSFDGGGGSVPTFTGDEGTNLNLPLELSDAAGVDVDVSFSVAFTGSASGSDASVVSSSPVTIPAGATSGTITVSLMQDQQEEVNEGFTVSIDGATNAVVTTNADQDATGIIIDDDRIGPTGPAGVGDAENLVLWLDADNIESTGSVTLWPDASQNGNDASAGTAPAYIALYRNGRSGVQFDGSDDWLQINGLTSLPSSGNTLITATTPGSLPSQLRGIFTIVSGDGRNLSNERGLLTDGTTELQARNGTGTVNVSGLASNQADVFSSVYDGQVDADISGDASNTSGAATGQGVQFASLGSSFQEGGNDNKVIELAPTAFYPGTVGDFIAYAAPLSSVQRTLVANYLSAKYDIAISATSGNLSDVYAGDDGANGDYDLDVFGVGYESSTNFHVSSRSGGLRFDNIEGLDAGDYLLAGHKVPDSSNRVSGGSTNTTGIMLDAQVEREWYLSETDGGTAIGVDIAFDLSDMGLGTSGSGDIGAASGYVLITRDPDSGSPNQWHDIAMATNVSGDQITFSNVAITDGNVITLATTDQFGSPLNPIALIIEGNVGNEGDATIGERGDDAGYRLIGPPVVPGSGSFTGADLESDTDPQLVEFNIPFPMLYYWDDANGAWAVANATETMENGRGALLYILDDEGIADADPIDPTITITPTTGELQGTSDVTIGTTDPLNTSGTFHSLANPYPYAFNLEGNLTANSGAFVDDGTSGSYQASVQIWNALASGSQNGNTGTWELVNVNDGADDLIAVWQGFLVERSMANSGNDDEVMFQSAGLAFGEDVPLVGSLSRTGPAQQTPRIELRLVATNSRGEVIAQDEAAHVQFHPDATEGWDAYDASKFTPYSPSFVTLAPQGTLRDGSVGPKAIESRPVPAEDAVTIDLSVNTSGVKGTLGVEVAKWFEVPEAWTVSLIDTKGTADPSDDTERLLTRDAKRAATVEAVSIDAANKSSRDGAAPQLRTLTETLEEAGHPVRAARADAKSATSTAAKSTVPRYRLRIDPEGEPLPVEFGAFNGVQDGERIRLEWQTLSETSNDGFAVEVKPDEASAYREVGYVSGAGTTTEAQRYTFTVEERLGYGTHSFRLRQVDADGTPSYSKPITVEKSLDRPYDVSKTAPNPVTSTATMNVTVREEQNVRVEVFDLLGRRVALMHDGPLNGGDTKKITLGTGGLASGVYFILVDGETFQEVRRMTVVR